MPYLPNSDDCYGCGRANPLGLKVRFFLEDGEVRTTFTANDYHCSYRDTVHGGVLSALLDETLGWMASYHKRLFCYAAEIRVRFLRPARSGMPLFVTSRVANDRGRICETEGEITGPDGAVIAKGWGKYMPMTPEQTLDVFQYLHFEEDTITREELSPISSFDFK